MLSMPFAQLINVTAQNPLELSAEDSLIAGMLLPSAFNN
jgi:hypothetical protein